MQFRLKYPRTWGGIGALLALLAVIGAVAYYFAQPKSPTPQPPAAPSLMPQPLTPTQYQLTRSKFAPWKLVPSAASAAGVAMLMENGGTEVSKTVVRLGPAWKRASNPFQLIAAEDRSTAVRLRLNNDQDYEVGYGQAFIFQEAPTRLYAFRRGGQLYEISVQQLAG